MSLYKFAASALLALCVLAIAAVYLPVLVEHGGALSYTPAVLLPFTVCMVVKLAVHQFLEFLA